MAAVVVASFTFMGCPQDPCVAKKVDCGTNGTCLEGLCNCSDGYEGEKCETESRTKFLGTYAAFTEVATIGTTDYNTNVTGFKIETSSAAGNKVILTKFGNANETVVATVKGTVITIPAATVINVTDAGTTVAWTVTSGTISQATGGVKMDYVLTSGSGATLQTANCKVTLAVKQ